MCLGLGLAEDVIIKNLTGKLMTRERVHEKYPHGFDLEYNVTSYHGPEKLSCGYGPEYYGNVYSGIM